MDWLARKLNKPYYLLRPTQVLRRVVVGPRLRRLGDETDAEITLPWGWPLRFRANEQTGLCLLRRGVFDLAVCEALWRLADPRELTVDIGANIGQMTSVLAARAGPEGRVIAFEPHPQIFERLSRNVARWSRIRAAAPIELRQVALSAQRGVGKLAMEPAFDWNMGSAAVKAAGDSTDSSLRVIDVSLRRLDDELGGETVGVAKLDVEGYEHDVLLGAESLLREHRIRDVVFEQFDDPPTAATELLEAHGYSVFSLDQTLWRPIVAAKGAGAARRSGDDPSYLATIDPDRALRRLARRGWAVLGVGPVSV